MGKKMTVDFGTTNTVVACWDEEQQVGVPLSVPEIAGQQGILIPSLVHYPPGESNWYIGQQVVERGLADSSGTFRNMKRDVLSGKRVKKMVGDRWITGIAVARDFLTGVLGTAIKQLGHIPEEVTFTVPVQISENHEAWQHYEQWLLKVAQQAGIRRMSLLEEPWAAALGSCIPLTPGQVYFVFDFGGGTLDVAVVLFEADTGRSGRRYCHLLGQAGVEVGGMDVDAWLVAETLRKNGLKKEAIADNTYRSLSMACVRVKERLSFAEQAAENVISLDTDQVIKVEYHHDELVALLTKEGLFATIDTTIRRALWSAERKGYHQDSIGHVLLVGGGSTMPCVQAAVQAAFPDKPIQASCPSIAVACGAADFTNGVDSCGFVQHEYALRYYDNSVDDYRYLPVVPGGLFYPAAVTVKPITVKAAYVGQEQYGLFIYQLENHAGECINRQQPIFLTAEPATVRGEPIWQLQFAVDAAKRLILSAKDIRSDKLVLQDEPVVKLL
jgi:molecular chaperone DnaK (HSP70)